MRYLCVVLLLCGAAFGCAHCVTHSMCGAGGFAATCIINDSGFCANCGICHGQNCNLAGVAGALSPYDPDKFNWIHSIKLSMAAPGVFKPLIGNLQKELQLRHCIYSGYIFWNGKDVPWKAVRSGGTWTLYVEGISGGDRLVLSPTSWTLTETKWKLFHRKVSEGGY